MRYFILLPFFFVLCGCQGRDSDTDSKDIKPMVSEIQVAPTKTMAAFIVSQKPPHRPFDIKIWTLDLNRGVAANSRLAASTGFTPFSWAPDESAMAYINAAGSEIHLFTFSTGEDKKIGPEQGLNFTPEQYGYCRAIRFSNGGKYVAYECAGQLQIYDLGKDKIIDRIAGIHFDSWRWTADSDNILFNHDNCIKRAAINSGRSDILYSPKLGPKDDFKFAHLTLSPDPNVVGFYVGNVFYALNLASREATQLFSCDHYFATFDWQKSGIVYLDAVGGERRRSAKLMLFDPSTITSKEIAVGPFAFASWAQGDSIIARSGNSQVVLIDSRTGASRLLFDAQDQAKQGGS